jgi:hypothetical protein
MVKILSRIKSNVQIYDGLNRHWDTWNEGNTIMFS